MRKSRSAHQPQVVIPEVPGEVIPAPKELSPDEAIEWDKIFANSPPGFFLRETHPLIVQLCRHICQSRFIGECLQEVRVGLLNPRDAEECEHLDRLTRLHDREGRAIQAIMDKLRMTTRASTTAAKTEEARANTPPPEGKTWKPEDDSDLPQPWQMTQ